MSDRTSIDRACLEELAVTDPSWFVRYCWPVIEPGAPYVDNWHIGASMRWAWRIIRDGGDGYSAEPPGYGKSIRFGVLLQAYQWLHRPEDKMLHIAGSLDIVSRDADKFRVLVNSAEYQRLIVRKAILDRTWTPDFEPWRLVRNSDSVQTNAKMGERRSFPLGAKYTGRRGRTIYVDDPVDGKAFSVSPPERQREICAQVIAEFFGTLSSRRSRHPEAKPARIVMHQRLHPEDLGGELLARGWDHFVVAEEYDPNPVGYTNSAEDPRTERGELAFPGIYDNEAVAERKEEWGHRYHAEANQAPRKAMGGVMAAALAAVRPRRFMDNPNAMMLDAGWQLRIMADTAGGSTKAGTSYDVAQAWQFQHHSKTMRLLGAVRRRCGPDEVVDFVADFARLWNRQRGVHIEKKALGVAAIGEVAKDTIERAADGQLLEKAGVPYVDPDGFNPDPHGPKPARHGIFARACKAGDVVWPHPDNTHVEWWSVPAREIAPMYKEAMARGELWVERARSNVSGGLTRAPWPAIFEMELEALPDGYDDQADCAAMAAIILPDARANDGAERIARMQKALRDPRAQLFGR